jgi:hypothetical protein
VIEIPLALKSPVKTLPSRFQRWLKKIAYNACAEGVNLLFLILLLAGGAPHGLEY